MILLSESGVSSPAQKNLGVVTGFTRQMAAVWCECLQVESSLSAADRWTDSPGDCGYLSQVWPAGFQLWGRKSDSCSWDVRNPGWKAAADMKNKAGSSAAVWRAAALLSAPKTNEASFTEALGFKTPNFRICLTCGTDCSRSDSSIISVQVITPTHNDLKNKKANLNKKIHLVQMIVFIKLGLLFSLTWKVSIRKSSRASLTLQHF